jgi:hypothetical protein
MTNPAFLFSLAAHPGEPAPLTGVGVQAGGRSYFIPFHSLRASTREELIKLVTDRANKIWDAIEDLPDSVPHV